jgi:hypothetical protein
MGTGVGAGRHKAGSIIADDACARVDADARK